MRPNIWQVILGFLVSTVGGALALWLLIEKLGWNHLKKYGIERKPSGTLTGILGIVERLLYTTSLMIGVPQWIAVWLALKVAVAWSRWQEKETRGLYNLFLIGNALSLIFGFIGAWIALGSAPCFRR